MSLLDPVIPDLESSWKELSGVVVGLLSEASSSKSFDLSSLYHVVYRLCAVPPIADVDPMAPKIYERLKGLLRAHVEHVRCDLEQAVGGWESIMDLESESELPFGGEDIPKYEENMDVSVDIGLLMAYEKFWQTYLTGIKGVASIFCYLDRGLVKEQITAGVDEGVRDVHKVHTLAMLVWKDELLVPVGQHLANACFRLILKERRERLSVSGASSYRNREVVDMRPVKLFLDSVVLVGNRAPSFPCKASLRGPSKIPLEDFDAIGLSVALNAISLGDMRPTVLENLHEEENCVLDFYHHLFESRYLMLTFKFYEIESEKMLSLYQPRDYIRSVEEKVMKTEVTTAMSYLDPATIPALESILDSAFVTKHTDMLYSLADKLLHSACEHIGDGFTGQKINQEFEDLSLIYRLLSRIRCGTKQLQVLVRRHVAERGRAAVEKYEQASSRPDLELAPSFVEAAYQTYHHFRRIIDIAFKGDSSFNLALDQGCSRYLNIPCFAALTAAYCHVVLSSSSQSPEVDEENDLHTEERLLKAERIFRYLDSKDRFRHFYAKYLAKRLIGLGSSSWFNGEDKMLARLRSICGYEYISRLQRMFTDVTHSHQEMALFTSTQGSHPMRSSDISFHVLVLTSTAWPLNTDSEISDGEGSADVMKSMWEKLPRVTQLTKSFRSFYLNRHSCGKFSYLPHLTRVVLRALDFPVFSLDSFHRLGAGSSTLRTRSFVIVCGPLVASILLLFNDSCQVLSLQEIKDSMKAPSPLLGRAIRSLLDSKLIKVVSYYPMSVKDSAIGRDLEHWLNDRTCFGIGAVSRDVNTMSLDDHIEERDDDERGESTPLGREGRNGDGGLEMQAAIVSVMKREKRCSLTEIVMHLESTGHLNKRSEGLDIRVVLAILEEKEYIKRELRSVPGAPDSEQEEVWEYLP